MLKEIINRFKRLNKDSKKYLQKRQKLEERYKYLSIISPLPKEKQIKEKIFLVNKDGNILIPYQFDNIYHKGKAELKCRMFNRSDYKVTFCSLTFEELKQCYEIEPREARFRIETAKSKLITDFEREVDYFIKEENGAK